MQILTIAELLQGAAVKMPPEFGTFTLAQKAQSGDTGQMDLLPKA